MKRYSIGFLVVVLPIYSSITVVYNLRIAETPRQIEIVSPFKRPSLGIATLFGTFREKYNGTKHRCGGGLFTFMYAPESFFVRLDTAVGRVASDTAGVHFSRTQADDLLFSGGYSPKLSERARLTFCGLFGIPTHKDTSVDFVQLGYGHYGLGAEIDGSYSYSTNQNYMLHGSARLVHFFSREITTTLIPDAGLFNYSIGHLAALLLSFHGKRGGHNVEIGYDGSFFFDAQIHPNLDDAVEKANYIRNSFYGIYTYRFSTNKFGHMVCAALSYGFEPTPKVIGNKRLITVWASWGISF
jgi:hypothetical protein